MRKFLYYVIFFLVVTATAKAGPFYFGSDEATLIPSKIGHGTSSTELNLQENNLTVEASEIALNAGTTTFNGLYSMPRNSPSPGDVLTGLAGNESEWAAIPAAAASTSSVLIGTENQVTVVGDGTATTTFSTPQDIHSTATPTFAGLTVNGVVDAHYIQTTELSATTGSLNISNAFGDIIVAADGGMLFLESPQGVFATSGLQVDQNLNLNASTVSTGTGDINISSLTGINLNSGTTTVNGLYAFPVTAPQADGQTIVSVGGIETQWGNATNAVGFSATTVSSNITLGLVTDTVYVNAAPSDVTVTLVSATTFGCNGKMVNVQLVSSSGTRVIVDAPQTISGTSTVSAGLPGDSYTFRCDGSVWHLENYSEVIKRQMSCHLFNPVVGAPTVDNDSGICSKWIQNVSANATVGDIEVRIMPGACSKPPACVAGVIDQSNYEWYVRHTASTLSKDLVVPHTFNPGVGNVDADMTLKCECLK